MLFHLEDAVQIDHGTSNTMEIYALVNPDEAWLGFGENNIVRTEDYFSDDELVDFAIMERAEYEAKISKGAAALLDADFPVLVAVRKERVEE